MEAQQGPPEAEPSDMFDLPAIEEIDPSLVDGYQLYYEREVPLELRSATSIDNPTEVPQ